MASELRKRGHKAEVLNGYMVQRDREFAMKNFRDRVTNIMVCTDVAARGIDVQELTHVFNYGLPQDNEAYVHRIGRTGRAGQKGKAYTIVSPGEAFSLRRIERLTNSPIPLGKLPSTEELKKKMVEKEVKSAQQVLEAIVAKGDGFRLDDAFEIFKSQFADLEREELFKLMFTLKFNKTFRHLNNLPEIESDAAAPSSRSGAGRMARRRRNGGRSSGGAGGRGGRSGGPRRGRSGNGRAGSGRSGGGRSHSSRE